MNALLGRRLRLGRWLLLSLLCGRAVRAAEELPERPETPLLRPGGPKLPARITQLLERLGHEEWAVREAAQEELVKIGAPAKAPLEKALRSNDLEVAVRARRILDLIGDPTEQELPDGAVVNGWQRTYGEYGTGQTIVAAGEEITQLRLRLARHSEVLPEGELIVELRATVEDEALGIATLAPKLAPRKLTWIDVPLRAKGLRPGATYHLIMRSPASTKESWGWLIGSLYQEASKERAGFGYSKMKGVTYNGQDRLHEIVYQNGKKVGLAPPEVAKPIFPINGIRDDGQPQEKMIVRNKCIIRAGNEGEE